MKYEYKRVSLKTDKEISKAERLQAKGWKIIDVGIASGTLLLERIYLKERKG